MKHLHGLYKGAFDDADVIFMTEVYSFFGKHFSGTDDIIREIESDGAKKCNFVLRKNIAKVLMEFASPNDVIVTMGYGNITHLSQEVLSLLRGL